MEKRKEAYLKRLYYDPKKPASFGGVNKLFHHITQDGKYNFTKEEIQKWLQSQEVHTTNRLVNRKIRRRAVIAPYIDYMWDVDTASFVNYGEDNKGFTHFILAIDVMSKYIWTKAIKTTSGEEAVKAFKDFFRIRRRKKGRKQRKGRIPQRIRTDPGTEFVNATVSSFLKKYGVKHFVTHNETKSNFSERGIQSVKGKLVRYMRSKITKKWIDQLDNVTYAYNHTIHRSTKQTPASVSKKDEIRLWKLLYNAKKPVLPLRNSYKFSVGDVVRISNLKRVFERHYNERWTNELFRVSHRTTKQYIAVYTLTDYDGKPIEGTFYEEELQKVYADEKTTYRVEDILGEEIQDGVKKYLVKWRGWPKEFNTWIPQENFADYT